VWSQLPNGWIKSCGIYIFSEQESCHLSQLTLLKQRHIPCISIKFTPSVLSIRSLSNDISQKQLLPTCRDSSPKRVSEGNSSCKDPCFTIDVLDGKPMLRVAPSGVGRKATSSCQSQSQCPSYLKSRLYPGKSWVRWGRDFNLGVGQGTKLWQVYLHPQWKNVLNDILQKKERVCLRLRKGSYLTQTRYMVPNFTQSSLLCTSVIHKALIFEPYPLNQQPGHDPRFIPQADNLTYWIKRN
jgi:hypothetical protein